MFFQSIHIIGFVTASGVYANCNIVLTFSICDIVLLISIFSNILSYFWFFLLGNRPLLSRFRCCVVIAKQQSLGNP
jgi:hypothetical protein